MIRICGDSKVHRIGPRSRRRSPRAVILELGVMDRVIQDLVAALLRRVAAWY